MTSTSTVASTPTTPRFTTRTTSFTIPRFTPKPGCANASNIFYVEDECSWGTGIGLHKPDTHTCTFFGIDEVRDGNNDCIPDGRDIATECPVQYTAVNTWEYENDDGETSREVRCCPNVYDFKWRGMATLKDNRGSSASLTISSCVARQPSFAGNSPWTLNITYWSSTGRTVVEAPTTAKFNPETDILVASVATFNYVINKRGSTCVPDCETPYTGGKWPPSATHSSSPPVNDSNLRDLGPAIGIIVGVIFGIILLCVGCCVWACRRNRKKESEAARRRASAGAVQEDQGGVHLGDMEGPRKAD